jgi:CheY-like chemotaxis protein
LIALTTRSCIVGSLRWQCACSNSWDLAKPVRQGELLEAICNVLNQTPQEQPALVTRHTLREERKRLRVLLAEDTAVNRTLAVRLLEKRGYITSVAVNGREALAVLEKERFDFVLMEFARSYPERTAGAVFAATFPQAETVEGIDLRNRAADRIRAEGIALFGCEILPKLIGSSTLKKLPSIAARVYAMICATDPAGAAAGLRGRALRRDYRESLKTFQFPCLIVLGSDDAYSSVEEAEAMNAAIPNSRLEIFSNCGHLPNLENEDRFNRHLHEFLSTLAWSAPLIGETLVKSLHA